MASVCSFSGHTEGPCGPCRGKEELVYILECLDDISGHLKKCHLSREPLREFELILFRCGMFNVSRDQLEHMRICPNHRYNLGKFWRPSRLCQYPLHTGQSSAVKGSHVMTVQLSRDAHKLFGRSPPIGSRKYILLPSNSCQNHAGSFFVLSKAKY